MNIEKIIVSYDVKRSRSYQSAGVGMTVEVSLSEGDTPETAFKAAMAAMIPLVEAEADAAVREAVRMDQMG